MMIPSAKFCRVERNQVKIETLKHPPDNAASASPLSSSEAKNSQTSEVEKEKEHQPDPKVDLP